MISEDIIEGIIALPPKLFYGTGITGCVLILSRNKPESRRKNVIFIYAARDYEEGKVRNKLRESDIQKIVSAFRDYKDVDGYCHVAGLDEINANEFNLNVSRYVDISKKEEDVDIQAAINALKKLEEEKRELTIQVNTYLREMGFNP